MAGPPLQPSALELVPVATREFRRHLLPFAAIFSVVALSALAWGVLRSPHYQSSTTIMVQDKSILAPLMEGRVESAGDVDRASVANQVIFSRAVMEQILRTGGWLAGNPSQLKRDNLIAQIRGRTKVEVTSTGSAKSSDPGLSLVSITYSDSDPQRAYQVTRRYGELLISETAKAKKRQSTEAFTFIDSQVRKYEAALAHSGGKLAGYRQANPDALPGADTDVTARIAELRRTIDAARIDLADASSQEAQVRGQLSHEPEIGNGVSGDAQYRGRLAELQSQRAQLLLTVTAAHPDVVRIDHQISQLQDQYRSGGARAAGALAAGAGSSASPNPLYSQLRANLASVRQQSAAAAARLSTSQAMLARELARSQAIFGSEGTLATLTTDTDVNRELYQDLLRRRENARVAMGMDAADLEANFHVQEPATVPLRPSGLRLAHFAGAGLVLAVVIPLLFLSLLIKHDPRVRSPVTIERDLSLPVLGSIPVHYNRRARARMQRRSVLASGLFLAVPVVYALVLMLKMVRGA